jgi:hypothetical protein
MSRTFRAINHLTLPQGVLPGPGATNMALKPGDVFTADDAAATRCSRFLNNRVTVGDLVELDAPAPDAPAPEPVKSIGAPAGDAKRGLAFGKTPESTKER